MTATVDQITRVYRLERLELETWIAHRWLRPRQTTEGPVFDEVDEARIALIRELRDVLQVNDETLDVVLSLLDQLYATRRLVRTLNEAVIGLPEPLRAQIRACIDSASEDT
jgi:chaperone modulatory protein CbpM